jgi:hypothetical protein
MTLHDVEFMVYLTANLLHLIDTAN